MVSHPLGGLRGSCGGAACPAIPSFGDERTRRSQKHSPATGGRSGNGPPPGHAASFFRNDRLPHGCGRGAAASFIPGLRPRARRTAPCHRRPCRPTATNRRHLYARRYDGDHHREVIHFGKLRAFGTSRPALLHGVARLTQHSGQRTVKVSLQHENGPLLAVAITAVSNTLHRLNAIAGAGLPWQRWTLLFTHIFRRWLGGKWLGELPCVHRRSLPRARRSLGRFRVLRPATLRLRESLAAIDCAPCSFVLVPVQDSSAEATGAAAQSVSPLFVSMLFMPLVLLGFLHKHGIFLSKSAKPGWRNWQTRQT